MRPLRHLVRWNRLVVHGALGVSLGALIAAAQVGGVPPAPGGLRWNSLADHVSADLLDVPLQSVLEQIRVATGWEVAVEPGLNYSVSTTFNELKSSEALGRLLRQSSFALVSRTNGTSRLLVFKTSMDRATREVLRDETASAGGRRIDDEWIVTLKPGVDAEELARKLGARITGRLDKLNAYRLKFDDAAAADAARPLLDTHDGVAQVDGNYLIERPASLQPMSAAVGQVPQINPAPVGAGGRLVIGLVDTAVQVPEGALSEFFLDAVSVAGEHTPSGAAPTHGTGMSNDILTGMAVMLGQGSDVNAAILPVDVFGASDTTSTFQLGQGLVEAWNGGATLINASIGSKAESAWLDSVIAQLTEYGATIVAPAGNFPDGLPTYPAANPAVLAVTAVGPDGRLAPYANYAPFVDIAMSGNSVVNLTGEPYFMSGTSVATARATGAIAGYSLRPGQTMATAVETIRRTRGVQATR